MNCIFTPFSFNYSHLSTWLVPLFCSSSKHCLILAGTLDVANFFPFVSAFFFNLCKINHNKFESDYKEHLSIIYMLLLFIL